MTLIQRRLNVEATSWRCIDVEATLYKRQVSVGCVINRMVNSVDADEMDHFQLDLLCLQKYLWSIGLKGLNLHRTESHVAVTWETIPLATGA